MKLRQSVCILALCSCLVPHTAIAQDSGITWHLTPWIGTAVSGGDIGDAVTNGTFSVEPGKINNAPAYGAFAGAVVGSHLIVEGLLSFAPSTLLLPTSSSGQPLKQGYDVDIVSYGANLGWAFSSSKTAVVPFLLAGVGGASFNPDQSAATFAPGAGESTTDVMFNFGGGLWIPIGETVQLRLDARDYVVPTNGEFSLFPSSDSSTLNTFVLSAGVTLHSR